MLARQLWFEAPFRVAVRTHTLPPLQVGQMLVKTLCSAISAGTELLVYRGQLPADTRLDATLDSLQHAATYPMPYGYACVGRVVQVGTAVDANWLGKLVFSFQPHASHFLATPAQLLTVPEDIDPEAAVFLANAETAVNLLHDGSPLIGERVVVLGQGVVGLLVSGALTQFPLASLHAVDGIAERRYCSLALGVSETFDPEDQQQIASLKQTLALPVNIAEPAQSGADLIYELSGRPEALNQAIELAGFAGRIVIGSWYGNKAAPLALGGAAHRHRLQFVTSQVSTIAPQLSGRWDKSRRFAAAWQLIRRLQPQQWITHRLNLDEAGEIYSLLDSKAEQVFQAVFDY